MNKGFYVFPLPQHTETPLTCENGVFSIRYAYARSHETKQHEDLGQDFLAFGYNENSFIFALCDGVSLSFSGDIASRILGNFLLNWLTSKQFENQIIEKDLSEELANELSSLTSSATEIVNQYEIPSSTPTLVKEVLVDKRRLGSESMYLCGRIDLPSVNFPEGRIILTWQGDSKVRLWNEEGEATPRDKIITNTSERWSTKKGVIKGMPNIFISNLDQYCSKLTIYSDGLSVLDRCNEISSDNNKLQGIINAEGMKSTSDDISFLEVAWNIKKAGSPDPKESGNSHQKESFPSRSNVKKQNKAVTIIQKVAKLLKNRH